MVGCASSHNNQGLTSVVFYVTCEGKQPVGVLKQKLSERTSEWPSNLHVDFLVTLLIVQPFAPFWAAAPEGTGGDCRIQGESVRLFVCLSICHSQAFERLAAWALKWGGQLDTHRKGFNSKPPKHVCGTKIWGLVPFLALLLEIRSPDGQKNWF